MPDDDHPLRRGHPLLVPMCPYEASAAAGSARQAATAVLMFASSSTMDESPRRRLIIIVIGRTTRRTGRVLEMRRGQQGVAGTLCGARSAQRDLHVEVPPRRR